MLNDAPPYAIGLVIVGPAHAKLCHSYDVVLHLLGECGAS